MTFKAVAKGGKELDAAFTFEIICSDRVVITASAALIETPATYQSWSKTLDGSGSLETLTISDSEFSTDQVDCPIEEISFTETTVVSTGYDLSRPSAYYPALCTDPLVLTNTGCRTVQIPTDGKVRDSSNGEYYMFRFTAKAKGGTIKDVDIQFGVDCSVFIVLSASDNTA